ncbi:D-alanyl-D-alanine carboxypeptidase [Saccharothrix tamanrassetensis]|uniref:D-alanyl-D-alanine carboxypeptidase n=1 Tax=Saccharothrix tamanrassetensis TaxID=1051531 RepID=A0A841CDL4_9PSEU|nr:serine hydrolase domain-containing protein [Saccharothrix tamanrassetensis]MBB5956612.1 D-alanyl-D-alanine carboxypeptidase [Saccharothrix tamanrassetensis]
MRKLLIPLLALIFVANAATATALPVRAEPPVPPLNRDALRAAVADLPNDEISGALVRVSGTAGSWRGTGGVARIGTGQPVQPNGRFRIGSMTKLFTATAALQLSAQGKLDLDQTVQHYLPGLLQPKDEWGPITVRQLLNHTHGIAGVPLPHKDPAWFFAHRYDAFEPLDLVRMGVEQGPRFPAGTRQEYGNMGYLVAGLVIEKATGKPYGDAIRDGIIRPLHLHNTSLPGRDHRIKGPHAHGYEATASGYVDVTESNPSLQWAAAEVISNAPDLDRLLNALVHGDLLPAEQRAELTTLPPVPGATHALGVQRIELAPGLVLWGKTGDRPGYNNGAATTEDGSRTLVYSVNTLHMGGDQPAAARRIITAAFS